MEDTAIHNTLQLGEDRYTSKEHWDNYFAEYRPKTVETVFFCGDT